VREIAGNIVRLIDYRPRHERPIHCPHGQAL
jgi:hypothetical protein